MNRIRALTLAAAVSASSLAHAVEFSSLEERMSRAEFTSAGLDKLSPEQLKSLNEWLRYNGLAPGAPVAIARSRDGVPEYYPDEKAREPIVAHIEGKLDGWMGKTTFKLDNGQVWQSVEERSAVYPKLPENAEVEITRGFFGYRMEIKAIGRRLAVKRIS